MTRKLFAPAIFIPVCLLLCSATTVLLPAGDLRAICTILLYGLLAYFASVLAHEIGHVIGGVIAGYKINYFMVGPIVIEMVADAPFKLKPNWGYKAAGFVKGIPTQAQDSLRKRLIFILFGPLASILLGIAILTFPTQMACKSVAVNIDLKSSESLNFPLCIQPYIGLISLYLGIWSLIPLRIGNHSSDGALILQRIFGSPKEETERHSAFQEVVSLLQLGKRPRDIPLELIKQTLQVNDNAPAQVVAHLLAYDNALDLGNHEQANVYLYWLQRHFRRAPEQSKAGLAYDIAFHEAIYRQNVTEARLWLNDAKKFRKPDSLEAHRAEAAVLFLEGKTEQAKMEVSQCLPYLKKLIDAGTDVLYYEKDKTEVMTRRYMVNHNIEESE